MHPMKGSLMADDARTPDQFEDDAFDNPFGEILMLNGAW